MESCHPQKGGLSYASQLPCLSPALRSAGRISVCVCVCASLCVRDMCVHVLALVGNDFEKHGNTPKQSISPTITPLESTRRCCYWLKCVAAPVFFFFCTVTFFGTDSSPIRVGWVMADDTDSPQERLGRGLSFGSAISIVSLFPPPLCAFVGLQCVSVFIPHFCSVCVTK